MNRPHASSRGSAASCALRLASSALLLAAGAAAQVPLSGTVSDTTTGPLLSGTVYHATGSLNLPTGQTLTIQPGAIVKFDFDRVFTVGGTLLCNGTGPGSVIFTDIRDDTAGGDTNGDGNATAPASNWWRYVQFSSSASGSVVRGLEQRYGGRFGAPFNLLACDATFEDCISRDAANDSWNFNANSNPTLTNCAAVDCTGIAFRNVRLDAVPAFTGLSATGNGVNWVDVTAASLAAGSNLVIGPQNGINGVLHLAATLNLPSTSQLTLEAGLILKMGFDRALTIIGALDVNGTAAQPVWITDERDDTVGGDSNSDGNASAPATSWWRYLDMRSGASAGAVRHLRLRYGGRFGAGIQLNDCDASFQDVLIADMSGDGFNFQEFSRPTLSNVTVRDCVGSAFNRVAIQALASFSGLSATGNGQNWLRMTSSVVGNGEVVAFGPANLVNGVLQCASSIQVQNGGALTIQPGTVCKMGFDRSVVANGLLTVDGGPGNAVWFTDERDDTQGGDTNGDGVASVPASNWWRGVQFNATSDGSSMEYTNVRYGGRFQAGVVVTAAMVTLDRCRIEDIANAGLNCNNNTDVCSFEQLVINRCSGEAIQNVKMERVVDFFAPRGTGNGKNRMVVSSSTISGLVTIDPVNQFAGSLFISGNLTIPGGAELNLQPGVVFKMGFDRSINVLGRFTVRGSIERPVILTDERDDSVGGDSNGDGGASVPASNWWRGISFNAPSDLSIVLGLEARYGGRFQAQINVVQPTAVLREVRSEFCASDGFRFGAHPVVAQRLVAYQCAGDGFELTGGSFDLRQVTSVGNSGMGVRATAGWTGDVLDSIARGNAGGAYAGVGAGRVRYSNGDPALAGTDGNIDVDPDFVDEMNGDLHVLASSPCINTGDPASPLDPDSTRADMGAYFFNFCEPSVFCPQAVFPPCDPTLSYEGFCSLSSAAPFWLRLEDSPTLSFAVLFYGIGTPTVVSGAFGNICVGGPYQRTPPVASGGNPNDGPCRGLFEFDFNAWAQSGADPAIVAGSNVIAHFWFRYGAAPGNALFSTAIEIPVCP